MRTEGSSGTRTEARCGLMRRGRWAAGHRLSGRRWWQRCDSSGGGRSWTRGDGRRRERQVSVERQSFREPGPRLGLRQTGRSGRLQAERPWRCSRRSCSGFPGRAGPGSGARCQARTAWRRPAPERPLPFLRGYSVEPDAKKPDALTQYQVGSRETVKVVRDRPQGAPDRVESNLQMIYTERAAKVSREARERGGPSL